MMKRAEEGGRQWLLLTKGGLTTHGAPGAIGDHGAPCPCLHSKHTQKSL
ncbi:unnamed protein product [Staurois parvus]|uniref:Uncharacterized protein n=1 Tax=Staurois parvus TaxID=386267 RepID=A0ABN9CXP6_9NEOB|nr:unnamed protein product [Staurois parvus]